MAVSYTHLVGYVLTLILDCSYEGLCFVPLSPFIRTSTVLVWKNAQVFSPAASA